MLNPGTAFSDQETRVVIPSGGWELVGDLLLPHDGKDLPAVLMLNQAAGNRRPYEELAAALSERGIASLRLDLRGHGESINLGEFIPDRATEQECETLIWDANEYVVAAHQFLLNHPNIDADRIAVVGASYSGEEMAEAGRDTEYAAAYVALSPGSFSDESIADMDASMVPWLLIVSRKEPYLHEIAAKLHEHTRSVEIIELPGDQHATSILDARPEMADRIATWLAARLTY